jgi:hypothetical protein
MSKNSEAGPRFRAQISSIEFSLTMPAALLIDDFGRATAHFDKHPVHTPMTEAETGGFKHT